MNKPPRWFVVTVVVALIWNLLGCFAFISDVMLTPDDIARLPDAQQALYHARPGWAVWGTALAVIGGAVGCVALLLRTRLAVPVFISSLAGLLVQDYGLFVVANGVSLGGPVPMVLQSLVFIVAVGLVLLSRKAASRAWLE